MNMQVRAAVVGGVGMLLASTGTAAGAAPVLTSTNKLAYAAVYAAHKGRIDVDVRVINTHYAYYWESYTEVDVRAYYRKSHKRLANGTVEVSVTLYPTGLRQDSDGNWAQGGTGDDKATETVTVQLNGKGHGKARLGENCRYCSIPPLAGGGTTSTGIAYRPDGIYLGTDVDTARKNVVQRVVKGEKT